MKLSQGTLTVKNFLKCSTAIIFETVISITGYPVVNIPVVAVVQLHLRARLEIDIITCSITDFYFQNGLFKNGLFLGLQC